MTIATTSAAKHCKLTQTDGSLARPCPGRPQAPGRDSGAVARLALTSAPASGALAGGDADGNAVWKTSIRGPVRGGPRDHLIPPIAPDARDLGKVVAALRQAS